MLDSNKENFFNKNKPPALDNTQRNWERTDMLTYIHPKCIHFPICCQPEEMLLTALQLSRLPKSAFLYNAGQPAQEAPTTVGETLSH